MSSGAPLPRFLLVLRGPAGAGKSTLAKAVRARVGYPTAAIDTDLFAWEIVPAESNLGVRYEGLRLLVEHYLRSGYSVIVSGLVFTFEDPGAIPTLRQFAEDNQIAYVDAFCEVSLTTALDRNRRRPKGAEVEAATVETWWADATEDRHRVSWPVLTVDLEQPLEDAVEAVLRAVASGATPSQASLAVE